MIITTAQVHLTKPKLIFYADSNTDCGVSKVSNDENIWQWFQLELRLNAFRQLTIPQK